MPDVVWSPHPGSQSLYLACPIFECLYEGTRGPGKTDAILMDFGQHCGRGFGQHWRGVIFRRTYKQLDDLVAKSRKWFRRIWPGAKLNRGDYTWTWPDGEELLFRYFQTADDYWNYHGHEYPFVGWEELTSWPTPECYESGKAFCRSSHPGMPRKYRATTNPYGSGHHWVKSYFIDPAPPGVPIANDQGELRVRLRGHWSENPHLTENDPQYIRNLASISNTAKRKAWLDGDWNIVAGGMLDDLWDDRVHVVRPFPIPDGWRIDRSFDWGSSHPFATLWFAQANGETVHLADGTTISYPAGTLFVISEDYGWTGKPNKGIGLSSPGIAKRVLEREKVLGIANRVRPGPADTQIWDMIDGRSIAAEMLAAGVRWTRAAKGKGSRIIGWQKIRDLLEASMQRPMERPGLFVFDTCRQFIRTVPALPRAQGKPDDVDTESEDHIGDALRYRVTATQGELEEQDLHGI